MAIGTPVTLGSNTATYGSASSVTMTTVANIVAADLVVVGILLNNGAMSTVTSVSDGTNSYTKANNAVAGGFTDVEIWYKENATAVGSGATITANFSPAETTAGNGAAISAVRITGIVVASALDKTATATGTTGTSLTATTASLSQITEIAIGCAAIVNVAQIYSGASGFTNVHNLTPVGNGRFTFDYDIVAATTAIAFSPTWALGSSRISAVVATFKGFDVVNVNVTGVVGTGAVGTVTPGVQPTTSGVAGTGQAGTVTTQSTAIALPITGVQATGQAGNVVPTVLSAGGGVAGVGIAGTVTPSPAAVLAGAAAAGQVGTLFGSPSISISGVSGSGQAGVVTTIEGAVLIGVSGTGSANQVFPIGTPPVNRAPLLIPSQNGLPASLWLGNPNNGG